MIAEHILADVAVITTVWLQPSSAVGRCWTWVERKQLIVLADGGGKYCWRDIQGRARGRRRGNDDWQLTSPRAVLAARQRRALLSDCTSRPRYHDDRHHDDDNDDDDGEDRIQRFEKRQRSLSPSTFISISLPSCGVNRLWGEVRQLP